MTRHLWKLSPPGIRVQLTWWYTVVSAALVLLFCITLYTSLQQLLASSFDTTLQLRSQQVAEGITFRRGRIIVDDVVDELPELDATAALVDSSGDDGANPDVNTNASGGQATSKNILVRVLDRSGKAVYWTSNFNKLTVPSDSVARPLKGVPWRGTIYGAREQPIRLYSTMLVDGKKIIGVIQMGQSLAGLNATLQQIAIDLLLITPFLLALSAMGSYWLSGRAFEPIHRLTHTAREIGIKDLHQRVPVPLAKDEVQDFAIIFNQMIGRLERAFIQQRRFVADASHELRTPAAVIRSMTEVALSQPASIEDYVTVLQEVNAESEHLGRLINDLLALARVDEGQIKLDQEPVRLDLLAADVVESLATLASERKITLCICKLAEATILGDAARLIQVMMSLVDNALIYTNAGGSVTLSVEACASHAHLIVQDTGIGMAQKDMEHIFERFYRADPARSKAVGGSGLGLAIVDWVVRAHRGTVTVESQVGQGSTFVVTLPLAAMME